MANELNRPNPESLLSAINKQERNLTRGQLKIFLGMCPGVGKTFSMLKAAKLKKKNGKKVAIGLIETHERVDTINETIGLDVIPLKKYEHKGFEIFELNLEEIIKQKTDLVLVDELAHTNTPECRHAKRHQDIEEILSHGISVYTTVNIQHIESLKDSIFELTGVQVRENVPDAFFDLADQIEIIDISPEELLIRLKEGKVYLGDRATRALDHFFKLEHLIALRELALRFVALKVDHDLKDHLSLQGITDTWKTSEKLLVAISYSPSSELVIRSTRKMSAALDCQWFALYVQTSDELEEADLVQLKKNKDLVMSLGGELISTMDTSILNGISRVCRDKQITQVVLGRPDRRFFIDFFNRGTLFDNLIDSQIDVDVHVVRSTRQPIFKGSVTILQKLFKNFKQNFKSSFFSYYAALWLLLGTSLIAWALSPILGYRSLGSLFLVVILFFSTFMLRGPLIFCALLSAFIWNFFFIPPHFTLIIQAKEDMLMVFSYFIAALVGSILTSKIKKQEAILDKREKQTYKLYEFTKKLSNLTTEETIFKFVKGSFQDYFDFKIYLLKSDPSKGKLINDSGLNEKDFSLAQWVYHNNKKAGWSTKTLSASSSLALPLSSSDTVWGVLLLFPQLKEKVLNLDQENLIDSLINQSAIAIEKIIFSKKLSELKISEASKILHQTLLNSVSHEMRTPLTAMIGSATALNQDHVNEDQQTRKILTNEIVQSAKRLNRVVENLLDLSRLERGELVLKKEWFHFEDFFQELKSLSQKDIGVIELKKESSFDFYLKVDFTLLQHAFSNLISNSYRYVSQNPTMRFMARTEAQQVVIFVSDNGDGVKPEFREQVFEKFYRVSEAQTGGIGLGLAIVRSIIELHRGSIVMSDEYPGACFKIVLPLEVLPKEMETIIQGSQNGDEK